MRDKPFVLAIIPCRRGSKRLPGKNMASLGGRPLIDFTLKPAMAAPEIDRLLITSDDSDILSYARKLGIEVTYKRPAALSQDETTSAATILHALDWFRDDNGSDPHFLMLLQVTSPFRPTTAIRDAVQLINDGDAVVGVKQLPVSMEQMLHLSDDGYLVPSAIDTIPNHMPLIPNGAMYLIRTSVFRENHVFLPARTVPLGMNDIASIDIDTPEDMALARVVAEGMARASAC